MNQGAKNFVIYLSVCMSSAIALIVIVSAIMFPLRNITPPEALVNWGGMIIGFYFGSFVGLLKDWSGVAAGPDQGEKK